MGVERREPVKMPQPEQWLSEHPAIHFLIWALLAAATITLAEWL